MVDSFEHDFDFVLVGGGLQNGLIALALQAHSPGIRVALVERDSRVGGNHTWCFHAGDLVDHDARSIVEPLLTASWPGYEVRFTTGERRINDGYFHMSSERFAQRVHEVFDTQPGFELFVGETATELGRHAVVLGSGRCLRARVVIDARGPDVSAHSQSGAGYQKFFGLEVESVEPHGVDIPVLMDSLVDQSDGYRFFYLLPLGKSKLLVEDTRFSDSPHLDISAMEREVHAYLGKRGIQVRHELRREQGVLPLPWKGDLNFLPSADGPLALGYRGNWFHPVTGYSFPIALRTALRIAKAPIEDVANKVVPELAEEFRAQLGFCHRLNKMFFQWFEPKNRHHVMARFYTHPESLISRFYSMTFNSADRARMLVGRPPKGMSYKAALFGRNSL